MEHLCDCDLSSAGTAAVNHTASEDETEARLRSALSLSPFRQQFDNFASLIQLSTDSTQVSFRFSFYCARFRRRAALIYNYRCGSGSHV